MGELMILWVSQASGGISMPVRSPSRRRWRGVEVRRVFNRRARGLTVDMDPRISLCMNFYPVLALIALLASLSSVWADDSPIRILRAVYGRPEPQEARDVRRLMDQYARTGKYTIRINPASMGGDPNPGQRNFLVVEYEVKGKTVRTNVNDGDLFVFQGVGAVPTRELTTNGRGALRIVNNFPHAIRAYHLNKWGTWQWGAEIEKGDAFNTTSNIGTDWVITNTRNANILYRFKMEPGQSKVIVSR